MKEKLMRLLKEKAKDGKILSESDKAAKKEVTKHLSDMFGGYMADDIGAKQITIGSDSLEGLEEGVEKAGELLESGELEEMGEECKADKIARLQAELAALEGAEE